jgi:hypothetical protein
MEILKFDESGTSSPSRKRSGRGAILVTFVALVFGAGTALASGTLTINNTNTIALDQGVAQTIQCDSAGIASPDGVGISLDSALSADASTFYLHGISVSRIANGCVGKIMRLKIYNSAGAPQTFCDPTGSEAAICPDGTFADFTVTDTSAGLDTNSFTVNFSNVLEIDDRNTVKNVTIETIG